MIGEKKQPKPKKTGQHEHVMQPVVIFHRSYYDVDAGRLIGSPFADGENVTIYCSAGRYRPPMDEADFGLYADQMWSPLSASRNEFINWPDFSVPACDEIAHQQIIDAFIRACKGEVVEIGCIGGHGRTGTILACMHVIAGYDPDFAINLARRNYCHHAVETPEQEEWVRQFSEVIQ